MGADPRPNLLVIGAMKCGTTSLHNYLDLHPEIAMAPAKELNFFDRDAHWLRGLDWYLAQFDAAAPVRGESSPNYTKVARTHVPARMRLVLPADTRLIMLVRDPVDRAVSHYFHAARRGRDGTPAEALAARDSPFVARGRYWSALRPYLDYFDAERILVVTQEELLAERAATLRRVFGFLGVDDGFTHPDFERRWRTREGGGDDAVAPELRAELMEWYRPELEALEAFAGRRLFAGLKRRARLPWRPRSTGGLSTRLAGPRDLPAIQRAAGASAAKPELREVQFAEPATTCVIAERDGEPAGVCALQLYLPLSGGRREARLVELQAFAEPAEAVEEALRAAAERWARERGCDGLTEPSPAPAAAG